MWIPRKIRSALLESSQQFPSVLITGPRQIGKTSLLRKTFPEAEYVTLDSPSIANRARETPDAFLSSFSRQVILDEVQYAPDLFRFLKILIDQNPSIKGKYLLTGSQTFPLMQGASESLAGRCAILEMQSLSFEEIRNWNQQADEIDALIRGGFPALYTENLNVERWYGSYLSTYLERDVRNVRQVGNLNDFERLLRAVASRVGTLLSYSDLARDVGISVNTVKAWISVLQASAQVILLEPYFRNVGKRLVKSPKLYMSDTGLACYLTGLNSQEALTHSPLLGAIWENHVVTQWTRYFWMQGKKPPLWFFRTAQGDEVDLLIEQGGRFVAIECKWTEHPDLRSLKGFESLQKMYGKDSLIKGLIACRTKEPFPIQAPKIWAIPGSSPSSFATSGSL